MENLESAVPEAELPVLGPPKLKLSGPIKVLATTAALLIVTAFGAVGYGIVAMRNFFMQAIDPQYMRDTAIFVTGVADPVPEPGFKPIMAAHLTPSVVFLENAKDKSQVSFWTYKGEDLDAVQELDRVYDRGIWTPSNWAKFQSIANKGKTKINGKTITFVQGPLKDQSGDTYEGLIACTIEGDKIVVLQMMQPSDRPFDTDKVLAWLARP